MGALEKTSLLHVCEVLAHSGLTDSEKLGELRNAHLAARGDQLRDTLLAFVGKAGALVRGNLGWHLLCQDIGGGSERKQKV